ncbi:MAG: alpha/beta hydrolase family protein [Gammaproteobacteria bacterium]
MRCLLLSFFLLAMAGNAGAGEAPSRPAVDAPELARLGGFRVGVAAVDLVDVNRPLTVDVWYPANVEAGTSPETYSGSLPAEPPAPPTRFTIPGIAVRNAPPAAGRFPLVIVSHGYSNETVAMSWLTENLASKGYVVAAIRHADPPITDRSRFAEPLFRRPLDIAFVAKTLQRSLPDAYGVDPARLALIGYSMGGYGILTAAGAELDPDSPLARIVSVEMMAPYARGGASQDSVRVPGVKAVVALAPGGGSLRAWGTEGLRAMTTPLLLISGDRDFTVDYQSGARAFFDLATNCHRYLLTFKGAGHRIGLGPAPDEMRFRLWDFDWFEDPVWRQDRIVGINLHFITAFLDRYVKDDASRASYLDRLIPESAQGAWPASAATVYDAYSAGAGEVTVWKGFQRQHAEGLEMLYAAPHGPE